MGRAKKQARSARRGPDAKGGKAKGRPANLSQFGGTEDRDGTVLLPKPVVEGSGRVIRTSS